LDRKGLKLSLLIADIKIVSVKKCFNLDQEHKLKNTMTALTGSTVMY